MEQAQQFMGGLSQGHLLKIFHKEVSNDWTEWGDHSHLLACRIVHQWEYVEVRTCLNKTKMSSLTC